MEGEYAIPSARDSDRASVLGDASWWESDAAGGAEDAEVAAPAEGTACLASCVLAGWSGTSVGTGGDPVREIMVYGLRGYVFQY